MEENTSPDRALANAFVDLNNANERLVAARKRSSAATRDECDATNAVNNAQKAIDALVAGLKKSASWNTDWSNARTRDKPAAQEKG